MSVAISPEVLIALDSEGRKIDRGPTDHGLIVGTVLVDRRGALVRAPLRRGRGGRLDRDGLRARLRLPGSTTSASLAAMDRPPMPTLRSLLLYLAVAALTLLAACDMPGRRDRRDPPAPTATAAQADREAPRFAPRQLEQHFDKHGGEMGFATKEAYLRAAQAIVRGGTGIETYQRGDDTLFFKESTDEFAVLSGRGVIRTYFKPSDGRRYWERQRRR